MPIDSCQHTFKKLASHVLPSHMKRMHAAIRTARPLEQFAVAGIGVRQILRSLNRDADFRGCYVLIDPGVGKRPVYVGISRTVVARLIQHVKGRTHYDASLAYRMACGLHCHGLRRSEAMSRPTFIKAFQVAQERLRKYSVAFIEIECDLELYLFEPYCAMELDTGEWNSFRTH